jgi:hypothetical protein
MQKAPLNKESTVIGFQLIAHQKMESTLPITCFSAGTAIADWVTDPNLIEHKSRPSLFLYPNQGQLTSTTWNIFITKLQVAYTVGTNNLPTGPPG